MLAIEYFVMGLILCIAEHQAAQALVVINELQVVVRA